MALPSCIRVDILIDYLRDLLLAALGSRFELRIDALRDCCVPLPCLVLWLILLAMLCAVSLVIILLFLLLLWCLLGIDAMSLSRHT